MKNIQYIVKLGFLSLAVLVLWGCSNPFEPPLQKPVDNDETALVRIYIGESAARTVQPGGDDIAGYRLAFTGGGTHDPVDITGTGHADVYLGNGTWTITATAYKLYSVIGNSNDAVASGSISVTVSGGAVSGTVPPIILGPLGTENGTLHYEISFDSGVSGYLKLWHIDGFTVIDNFGSNGELSFSSSPNDNFGLPAGRYIAEVKLTNRFGRIAFSREVVEIWANTTTSFTFSPSVYLDPNAVSANSKATLSETNSTFNNIQIGSGTGSGISEQDPKTYTIGTSNREDVLITLMFEANSRFSTVSWATNTGSVPDGTYSTTAFPTNFSTNNVLWIKAVSEDGSETVFYKFVFTLPPPSNGSFTDTDYNAGRISGTIEWTRVSDSDLAAGIDGYRIYYGSNATTKLFGFSMYPQTGSIHPFTETQVVETNTELPSGAKYFLIYSCNGATEYPVCLAIPIIDLAMGGTFGDFTVTGTNASGISYSSPYLTITQSGIYYITGTTTNDCIRVQGENITVDIVLKDVNVNVNNTAFDANTNNSEGVTVNLTIEGTNTLRSGSDYRAGLRVPPNGTLNIAGTGSLTARSSSSGAGIGGNYNEGNGVISIKSGTVTANSNDGNGGGSGIGSGNGGSDGTINIEGGTIAISHTTDAGIGGNGANINITGGIVNVTAGSQTGGGAGIKGANINITGGVVTVRGSNPIGYYQKGGNGIDGEKINITGGTVTAYGGNGTGTYTYGGTGINGENISITGGVITATGGGSTASGSTGIYSNTISITGGTVTANGTNGRESPYNGTGIGGEYYGTIVMSDALVFATSIYQSLTEGDNVLNSIVFIGNVGTLYGNFTLRNDLTVTNTRSLSVPPRRTLTIPENVTLTNNGTIFIYGGGTIIGTVIGNQPLSQVFIVSGDTGYTYTEEILTITGNGTYTIGMNNGFTSSIFDRITVAAGVNANITLSGINIDVSRMNNVCTFDMTGATVNLTLTGDNVLKSGEQRAGIEAPDGSTLVITGSGSLAATGSSWSAGIGGTRDNSGGNISITGGSVTATGGQYGSGIGGGYNGGGGTINIEGGSVTARGGDYGAGIGGGSYRGGGDISITGGSVTATGGWNAAGIGGGSSSGGGGGNISITGGSVTATGGGQNGSGIGGGSSGEGGNISITGGSVTATGSQYGPGIGGSEYYGIGNITVNNNAVIFASSIRPTLTEGDNVNNSIIFIENDGTLYGNVTFGMDVTFAAGQVLAIAVGKSLTIPIGITLTNNGTINNEGTINRYGVIDGSGTITGNQPE
jgi:hypothetical protein